MRAKGNKAPYAYIRKRFNHHVEPLQKSSETSIDLIGKHETIFDLGIGLMSYRWVKVSGHSNDQKMFDQDGLPNYLFDLTIGIRLVVKEVQEKEGPRYVDTVSRCTHCIFNGIDPRLENEQF
jgi:hypothetical protein